MSELGIATNKKVLEIFNMMKDGSLILRPRFQRKLVWNNTHKENFIETILMKLPFPEIYCRMGVPYLPNRRVSGITLFGRFSSRNSMVPRSPDT